MFFGWIFVRIFMTVHGIEHVLRKDLNLNYEISPREMDIIAGL